MNLDATGIYAIFRALQIDRVHRLQAVSEWPASFAEQRLWFLDKLNPQTSEYNLSAAVRIAGKLDVKALEQSLSEIVRRPETLRNAFLLVDGELMQFITHAYNTSIGSLPKKPGPFLTFQLDL